MSASPIRNADGKLAITPGAWHNATRGPNQCPVIGAGSVMVCMVAHSALHDEQAAMAEAHAALIAEAGTVTNQTGRTPAELAALVRELREAAFAVYDMPTECCCGIGSDALALWDKLKTALAKSEGV